MLKLFGFRGEQHQDVWEIDVCPGTNVTDEHLEDDVLVQINEPCWCWYVRKNGRIVVGGPAVELDEALNEAHLALKMLRLPA